MAKEMTQGQGKTESEKTKKKEVLKEKLISGKAFISGMILFIFTCLLSVGMEYFYSHSANERIRNTVMVSLGAGCVVYAMFQAKVEGTWDYDNEEHFGRFVGIYMGCMIFASILPLLPASAWPLLPAAVVLSLFSNGIVGLSSYATLVMYSVFLAEGTQGVFFLYFLCGMAAILLFRRLDEVFKVGVPYLLSLLLLLVVETAVIVLFINESLSWEMFIMPVMNLFLTGILLLCVLKYFSVSIIHKYRDRYLEINDPEFSLMAKMKEASKESYYLALHTAYFCERIATSLKVNSALAKAGGYYHRIGKLEWKEAETLSSEQGEKYPAKREEMLEGKSEKERIEIFCEEYEFPSQVRLLLQECAAKTYVSKESIIVMFSDAVVSAVLYLFEKEPQKEPDYEKIVDMIFKRKQENGVLDEGKITMQELKKMRQIFREEKLYYDFLH